MGFNWIISQIQDLINSQCFRKKHWIALRKALFYTSQKSNISVNFLTLFHINIIIIR
jgi:hypothetical protein